MCPSDLGSSPGCRHFFSLIFLALINNLVLKVKDLISFTQKSDGRPTRCSQRERSSFNTIHFIISSLIVINAFMLLILIVFIIIYSTAHFCFYKYSHCIKILFILWIQKFTLILMTDALLMKVLFLKKNLCMIIFHVVVHDIFNSTDVTVDLICDYLLLFFYRMFYFIDLIFL